jgi:hypothetical protein
MIHLCLRVSGAWSGMTHNQEELRTVWSGTSESDCVEFCKELQDAGILYEVSQTPLGPGHGMSSNCRFEIKVPPHLSKQAHALLDENPDEIFELPADLRLTVQDDAAKRTYLRELYPEDAIVEIWSRNRKDEPSIVELSLQTNLIRFRSELQDDGTVKLFVLPEDESRAREIVREIQEGKPPE